MTEESKNRSLLTAREREIFHLLVDDHTTKDIAGRLGISEKTVRNHISNTIQKLRCFRKGTSDSRIVAAGRVAIALRIGVHAGNSQPDVNTVIGMPLLIVACLFTLILQTVERAAFRSQPATVFLYCRSG